MEKELTTAVDIAHPDGRLRREAVGWARHPLFGCHLAPGLSRVSRWNYWCFTTRTCALTVLVADVGYIGGALISFLDFSARWPAERLYVRPLGLAVPLPDSPNGDVVVEARRLHLVMLARGDALHVQADSRTLLGTRITVDLLIDRPPSHETVNVLVPWDDTRFQFTSKQQALRTRGTVRVGKRAHHFGPDNEGFACLDFGRGRWPDGVEWNWAFASGTQGLHTIGFNLGGTWTEGTGVTENGVVIDGRLHKLSEAVDFAYDRRDFLVPWQIRTRDSARLDLGFKPLRERSVKVPLGFAHAELHQLMGHYSGTFVGDGGERIEIRDVLGLAEEVRGKW